MKTAVKNKTANKKQQKDYKINPSLQGKYDDHPLFQDTVNRSNHILKTPGILKFRHSRLISTFCNIVNAAKCGAR